ncbi:MAG: Winged helix-turn-helix DNA-binding [Frankiales bacterium]|jgi:plasmid maintenance system antidote protein VapI|nr:Winged helix-turn-helix DNA-binding [Frankiales bacterium]
MPYVSSAPARHALHLLALDRGFSVTALAEHLGYDRRTLQRIVRRSRLRSDCADRLAVALGRHPYELWPEWWSSR